MYHNIKRLASAPAHLSERGTRVMLRANRDSTRAMTPKTRMNEALAELASRLQPNAKSLVVSIFGDAVLPHGGAIWLGSLIDLVEPFGVNERVVRTSVFRLSKEGWLASEHIGRRSLYSLTDSARLRFDAAHRHIYAAARPGWDGAWTIVFTGVVEGEAREALRRDLAWQGFGQLAPGVMAHPDPDAAALRQALRDDGAEEGAVVMRGASVDWMKPEALRAIVARAWSIDQLAADYSTFLDNFRPLWPLAEQGDPDPAACFMLRTLLIHEYRRAILRDPMLPEELLAANWPGAAARRLCRNLYHRVQAAAERHLAGAIQTAEGPAPAADGAYHERFGGLEPAERALAEA
jgi:phenylacetic acid degradation operon negative regulatory protein